MYSGTPLVIKKFIVLCYTYQQLTAYSSAIKFTCLIPGNVCVQAEGMVKPMKTFPVDTGRKLNVHKTFRRRPGLLLNVLCTFNLRPVSTGLVLIQHHVERILQKIKLS